MASNRTLENRQQQDRAVDYDLLARIEAMFDLEPRAGLALVNVDVDPGELDAPLGLADLREDDLVVADPQERVAGDSQGLLPVDRDLHLRVHHRAQALSGVVERAADGGRAGIRVEPAAHPVHLAV